MRDRNEDIKGLLIINTIFFAAFALQVVINWGANAVMFYLYLAVLILTAARLLFQLTILIQDKYH